MTLFFTVTLILKRVSLPVRHFAARILASAIAAALALAVQAAEVTGEMAMAAAAAWTAENPALAQDIGVPVAVQARLYAPSSVKVGSLETVVSQREPSAPPCCSVV